MDTIVREIRHALRSLSRSSGFTVVAVVTLALAANLLPARRAARVDPLTVLREE